jgi:hypothetical protein
MILLKKIHTSKGKKTQITSHVKYSHSKKPQIYIPKKHFEKYHTTNAIKKFPNQ